MRNLIAGNWKMNGSTASIKALLQGLLQNRERVQGVELAVFPPFVYLELVRQYLQGSPIEWGAQNVCSEAAGAYTGEISAAMLQDFQCRYVIVGHSERRTLYGETNQQVGAKFAAALRAGLRPILCVGETGSERERGLTLGIIEEQLAVVLKLADNLPNLAEAVIAYEPVWAIGTGQNASPGQAQEVHQAIRLQLKQHSARLAEQVRILYGGSVKPENAGELFAQDDIDGALVGGASLQVNQFIEIAERCKR
jgi:triosephosphate isomerase (TIM)